MIETFHTMFAEKEELAPDVYRFRFMLQHGQKLAFKAGQYMILFVPQEGGSPIRRLYSILTTPAQTGYFDLVLDIFPNGVGSQYLMNRVIGDPVMFQGPAGMFFLKEQEREKVFIATGTGIVPMKSMLDSMSLQEHTTHLLWGLPTFQDGYVFKDFIAQKKKNPQFHLAICLSRERTLDVVPAADREHFMVGRVTTGFQQKFASQLAALPSFDYYLCGGREVVESLRHFLSAFSIPKERIHFEKF